MKKLVESRSRSSQIEDQPNDNLKLKFFLKIPVQSTCAHSNTATINFVPSVEVKTLLPDSPSSKNCKECI